MLISLSSIGQIKLGASFETGYENRVNSVYKIYEDVRYPLFLKNSMYSSLKVFFL
jgi:hypothetical protein